MLTCALFYLTESGKAVQARLLGTYIAEDATSVKTFVQYEPRGKATSNHLYVYLVVNYTVNNTTYSGKYEVQSFRSFDNKKANLFAKRYIEVGKHLMIYYDPKKPWVSVLHKEDELHFWVIFLIFLPLLTFSVILTIYGFMQLFANKKTLNRALNTKLNRDKNNEDYLNDYYNGELARISLQKWDGYYCQLFLLEDKIVVIHDESTFHYCRTYTFNEFLNKNIIDDILIEAPEIHYKTEIISSIKSMIK